MKWILSIVIFTVTSHMVYAENNQFSQITCDKLRYKHAVLITQIDKKSQYNVEFRKQEQSVFVLLQRHCDDSDSIVDKPLSLSDDTLLAPPLANMTYEGKLFDNDDKQLQWQKFYMVPARCREKETKLVDFVWCSANKSKQKRLFERFIASEKVPHGTDSSYSLVVKPDTKAMY